MIDGLTAKPLRIGELFANPYVFVSPAYQRPFAWEEKEAVKLLDEIIDDMRQTEGKRGRFLGTLLLIDAEADHAAKDPLSDSLPRYFDIVDGQQRLITLTILLAVLRDLEAAEGHVTDPALSAACAVIEGDGRAAYRVRPRRQDADVLAIHVQAEGATALPVDEDDFTGPAKQMIAVRKCYVEALSSMEVDERAALKQYLLDRCGVAVLTTRDIDSAHQMFSSLNGRGKPLARNDILKAEILGALSPDTMDATIAAWDGAAEVIGDKFEGFFSHIRAAEGATSGQVIESVRAIAARNGGARGFVENIFEPYTAIYKTILRADHAGAPESAAINRYLTHLGWLNSSEWIPPVMAWWRRCKGDSAQVLWFLRALDRLSFGCRMLKLGNGKRVTRFGAITTAVRRGEELTPAHPLLAFSRDDRRNIRYNLRELHERNAKVCKLLLVRLAGERLGTISKEINEDWTIEHILPKKPSAKSEWNVWYRDVDERNKLCNSLGNLILLPGPLNDKAKNHEFARKKEIYAQADEPLCCSLLGDVLDRRTWPAAEIQAREERLQRMIAEIWDFGEASGTAQSQQAAPVAIQTRAEPPIQAPAPAPAPEDQPARRMRRFGFGRR